jgi:hypothetical protein
MSNTASAVDVARRAIVNHDQRKREAAAKMKKAGTAAAASYGPPHCPGVFGTQSRVSSPTSLSPSSLAAFQEGHKYTPLSRFSPSCSSGEYPDGDLHGGFNPNSFFAPSDPHHGGFSGDLNTFPPGGINLNGSSPAHRHVPVCQAEQERISPSSSAYFGIAGQDAHSVFDGMGDDAMHHIINDGSMADDAYTQEEGKNIVDKEDEGGEEGGEYEEDDEPVVAAIASPAPAVKGKRKATPIKGGGSRGPKWQSTEDECLAEAWKTVSIDPISSANQNSDTYWETVKVLFDECKLMDPAFNKMHMDGNPSGMSHHWGIIPQACNKWHGIQQEVIEQGHRLGREKTSPSTLPRPCQPTGKGARRWGTRKSSKHEKMRRQWNVCNQASRSASLVWRRTMRRGRSSSTHSGTRCLRNKR